MLSDACSSSLDGALGRSVQSQREADWLDSESDHIESAASSKVRRESARRHVSALSFSHSFRDSDREDSDLDAHVDDCDGSLPSIADSALERVEKLEGACKGDAIAVRPTPGRPKPTSTRPFNRLKATVKKSVCPQQHDRNPLHN